MTDVASGSVGRWLLRRRSAAVAALAVVAAAAIGIVAVALSGGHGALRSTVSVGTTARVTQRDLVQHDTATGTLGYSDSRDVSAGAAGRLTWLPEPGTVIRPGQALYRLDGHAVFLFDGATALARSFEPGMTPGPDVTELKRALRELGFDPAHQLTADGTFDWATRAVVERWQTANRMPLTGTVPQWQVVFQPGPRRVGQPQVSVGATVTQGQVLFAATSAERIVEGTIDASKQSDLALGEHVTVDLLNGVVTDGTISSIDPVATTATSQDEQGQGQGAAQSSVAFEVRLAKPSIAGALQQAPVSISIDAAKAKNVLSVPVTALVAQTGGSYAVQVVRGTKTELVPVTPGFYSDDGYVQISGRVHAGEQVVTGQ